ncbi:MAG TPA: YdeI/OmpD-associated family protein [Candidatus Saccharimonadales bacterium]|nr:YdeI/OmpD-associated family protein [Candidatus Saccharimonadales bacterium]
MLAIHCKTKLYKINDWTILRLPKDASAQLPSRGQTMVQGTVNGFRFKAPLEPDGNWSHWLKMDKALLDGAHAKAGDTVTLEIEPTKEWPEPEVPADWKAAVMADPKAPALWADITPMARWEWIRWIRATGRAETRERRIKVGISKLTSGERRPCCWNRNMCTEPSVSKNGVLLAAE